MPSERVTHTEYIVRISVPKTTHEDFILRSAEFSKPVHDEIRRAISVAAQRVLRNYIRAGKLHRTFTADTLQ